MDIGYHGNPVFWDFYVLQPIPLFLTHRYANTGRSTLDGTGLPMREVWTPSGGALLGSILGCR